MSFYEILLAKKLENKRDPQVKGLTVTKNGTYSESGTVYNVVSVNVPLPENCYQKKSASGAMVSFTDGSNEPLSDLVIFITAAQSGSGDPSPTNIRPISGWTGANITNKDDIDNPTVANNYSVSWESEAGTVYGGNIDMVSGVLTVTHGYVDLGTLTWTYVSKNSYFYTTELVTVAKVNGQAICSAYRTDSKEFDLVTNNKAVFVNKSNANVVLIDTDYTNANELKASLSGVQFVYELATPLTYQLTPIMVRTLLGNNNIYADCGAIDVLSYFTKLN